MATRTRKHPRPGGRHVPKLLTKRSHTLGMPQGSPVYIGEATGEPVRITRFAYDAAGFSEAEFPDIGNCLATMESNRTNWINIDGLHQVPVIEAVGVQFGLHPLLLEDISNTDHRPSLEIYPDHFFISMKMVRYVGDALTVEHVSMVFGRDWVVSFQERPGDVFDPIRTRIRTGKGRVRTMGADYLASSLLDAVVDNYYLVLESMNDTLENLEPGLDGELDTENVSRIHSLKRSLILLRKSVWPLRDAVSRLVPPESALISPEAAPYFRNVYDHTVQIIDTIETMRDILTGILDTYLTLMSNRMNEVMKVLTIIATIFIPLTFIAGIYGMNFRFMPELGWRWGYFTVLGTMAVISAGMIAWFRRRHWM